MPPYISINNFYIIKFSQNQFLYGSSYALCSKYNTDEMYTIHVFSTIHPLYILWIKMSRIHEGIGKKKGLYILFDIWIKKVNIPNKLARKNHITSLMKIFFILAWIIQIFSCLLWAIYNTYIYSYVMKFRSNFQLFMTMKSIVLLDVIQ